MSAADPVIDQARTRPLAVNEESAEAGSERLHTANTLGSLWCLSEPWADSARWAEAAAAASHVLPESVTHEGVNVAQILLNVLGERQFGSNHWRLGAAKSLYYDLKPGLPRWLTWRMRRIYTEAVARRFPLGWPIEPRYVQFVMDSAARVLDLEGRQSARFTHFWPHGRRFAFVLTHDIEMPEGVAFVDEVAKLEERYGFRSSFNFILGRYRLDPGLLRDLQTRGFEIGGHGLLHDGKLFRSREVFESRAREINARMRRHGMRGFRAPLTHRNPVWMQSLEVEYDSSFFDTDPYEPIPGGTMSIWPFQLGHFTELPYTLPQDYVLRMIGDRSCEIWHRKLDFIRRHHGMALLNSHPDYLRDRVSLAAYERLLAAASEMEDAWNALPIVVSRWWSSRMRAHDASTLEGATEARLVRDEDGIQIEILSPRREDPRARPPRRDP